MYVLILNFPNQASITSFHSAFFKTWLYWNESSSFGDFIVDVRMCYHANRLNIYKLEFQFIH